MIKKGELILLYKDEERKYLIKAEEKLFHTDKGVLEIGKTIGKNFGEKIETNLGEKFYILKPSLYEMIMKLKRKTQIIYPKDIGIILMFANIFPGAKVIECGCGSGALTTVLANFVRPDGGVYSYEKNKEFLENAKNNVEKNGLSKWVRFKHKEVKDEFEEKEVDFIMIDIGSPWELIDAAYKSLKPGMRLATICPTFEQLTKTVFTLQEKGFVNIECMEILLRRILVRKGKTRPQQKMPSHTGWIIFANKVII
jgi:tRNA (adenine57-N1/adenine58-N1)-methyltransferase